MPIQCGKCNTDISSGDVVAKCAVCKKSYHPACTRAGSAQNFTKQQKQHWKCDSCKEDFSSNVSEDSSNEDKKSILETLNSMNTSINTNISGLRESIDSLKNELKQLTSRYVVLEEAQTALTGRVDTLDREKEELKAEVVDLRLQLHDAEQHSRCANIEIAGLPKTQGEDVYEALRRVAEVIGVPFKKEDVSVAHRLSLFSKKHSHPPIIAQFISRVVKEAWLSAARRKKQLIASEVSQTFPSSRVYINDQLTANNKALLGRARRLLREKRIAFAGYFNGKVMVKPLGEERSFRVRTLEEMDKFDR